MVAVLVTRPALRADSTIEKLRGMGYDVVHEPIASLVPLDASKPKISVKPIIVITSRSTLDVLVRHREDVGDWLACPCYCVGQKTAETARYFGFMDIKRAAIDGDHLAQIIVTQEPSSRPVLVIGAQERQGQLELRLRKNGWSVFEWNVYKAEPIEGFSAIGRQALMGRALDVALFFSPQTARTFVELVKKEGLEACCPVLTAIGLSGAVVGELSSLPFKAIMTVRQPTETDVLETLKGAFPSGRGIA